MPGLITVARSSHDASAANARPNARRPRPWKRALALTLPFVVAVTLLAIPTAQAQEGQAGTLRHASLTEATLALNRDLAREYARGLQLIHTDSSQDTTRRWQGSASLRPRNQATVYPTGEDGVMLEMTIQY
jgi:hypothetical protein